jgi:hypothetical protein
LVPRGLSQKVICEILGILFDAGLDEGAAGLIVADYLTAAGELPVGPIEWLFEKFKGAINPKDKPFQADGSRDKKLRSMTIAEMLARFTATRPRLAALYHTYCEGRLS